MKKFLGSVSPIDSLPELEQRSSMHIDPEKVRELLGTKDYPSALAKLYRIISNQLHSLLTSRLPRADAAQIHRIRDPIIP